MRHEWDTSNTSATRVKNFNFDNDTSKNMFSHSYIYYMASERLQGEKQFHSKNYVLEMPHLHDKMRLKSAPSFFKKITDIWNFQWIKYLGKALSYLRSWGIGVKYCWNYGPSNLLLHFIDYLLDQLNNKHTKTAVSSKIQYFESRSQKKCLLKVWSFLVHPLQMAAL